MKLHKLGEILNTPLALKIGMNLWPPFLFSGIRVEFIGEDFRQVGVSLFQRFYNRNYVGTHFGGSLFAMVDPFFMMMVMRNLGGHYYVWDRVGEIDFIAPGRGRVSAKLVIDQTQLEQIKQAVACGEKYEPVFTAQILTDDGQVVANYRKKLYVRLKPRYRP